MKRILVLARSHISMSSSKMTDEIPPNEEPEWNFMAAQNTTIEYAVDG